jgi:L-rhamnose mutarotase
VEPALDPIATFVNNLKEEAPTMERHAFLMKLKPGYEAEYKRRHDAIWPELATALRAAGVSDYSIYLDPATRTLFAAQKCADNDACAALPRQAIVKKWWAYMADIMETNPDNSPVVAPLQEVFHLE